MAETSNPMVVRLPIAAIDLTPLEQLLLTRLADSSQGGLSLQAMLGVRSRAAVSEDERGTVLACLGTGDPSRGGSGGSSSLALVITGDGMFLVAPGRPPDPSDTEEPREHVLLRFAEEQVRTEIRTVIAADETLTSLAPEMVSDADIHEACRSVVQRMRLDEEEGAALFQAALTAIRAAERHLGCGA